jgi:hypothetical protein
MPRTLTGSIAPRRVIISLAALLVKVTASTPAGETCPVCSSQAIRVVSTRVLPEPAPARIRACSAGRCDRSALLGVQVVPAGNLGCLNQGTCLDCRKLPGSRGRCRNVHTLLESITGPKHLWPGFFCATPAPLTGPDPSAHLFMLNSLLELGNIMEIFDYENILLLPRKCRVESRSECDASTELGGRRFRMPVVPANMKTVVDESICVWLAQNGYFYVMHRFDLDNVKFVQTMKAKGLYASISLGVKKADYGTVDQLLALGLMPDYVTIDIAHGHADSVKNMIGYLKKKMPERSSSPATWPHPRR